MSEVAPGRSNYRLSVTTALIEVDDGWELAVSGWQVTRCFVDPAAFGLLVDGGEGETLRLYLETTFAVSDADRHATYGQRDAKPADYAPLLSLMGRPVSRIHISRSGDLSIDFEDAAAIHVPPDPQFEAWELEGLGPLMIVCVPGGGEPTIFMG
jgi:hypothetical protein